MQLTFLGTGGAQQVPVFGCDCAVCEQARKDPAFRRQPCSAKLEYQGEVTLIDAGLPELAQQFTAGEIQRFWLTHYHMDHVQGLFPLRWGVGNAIPVYGPPDENGCDDLYKHPGILDFSQPFTAFETRALGALLVTALPLQHSRPTLGYLLEGDGRRIAYLTDTVGLPEATHEYLQRQPLDALILDCSMPPQSRPPRNHNDLTLALHIIEQLNPAKAVLTHIGHTLDAWLSEQPRSLPDNVVIARDGIVV